MGSRYFFYRVRHELERKSGKLINKHPINLNLSNKITLKKWFEQIQFDLNPVQLEPNDNLQELKLKAEKILSGNVYFFNAEWMDLGLDYDWITNPSTNFKYDVSKHWSTIPDLSPEAGDIKYVWEKSRFSWLLTLIQYDYNYGIDLGEFVFSQIESWIDSNPINRGPNWRCSQEISLRIFNWYLALRCYKDHTSLTDVRWEKIQDVIYASLHHVFHHIDFSRIAVRNNHAITETLFLSLSELLFPFIPETKIWSKKGRDWFEKEIDYQIYEDGTFLQFSMNYHRVVIQLLSFGISTSERAGKPFSKTVYERAYKSLDFLYQCLQEENGWLPNYGSNDGALFFPWSDTDYKDYKPQLNTLHYILTGKFLYADKVNCREVIWCSIKPSNIQQFPVINKLEGIKEYPLGGYVLIRDSGSFTFIRCGSHKDRPAQADNLHVDIWVNGINYFRDSGTYKYNTSKELSTYFTGTTSHNSVIVNDESQMLKGSRFIWYYWTQKLKSKISENSKEFVFEGLISAFRQLNPKGEHERIVRKIKGENKWIIQDQIFNLSEFDKKQIWHFDKENIAIEGMEEGKYLNKNIEMSYNSDYYGVMEKGQAISFNFKDKISTNIEIKS
ncbi:heparinase II/III-like protein [Sphingobacterium alimentarium]|uniref:Heparinase II/III-like protein n=2 Tax=Sphingobacterium alimentarium TaxID=797292 RepID=A0A4R3VRI7_9SPHI|nr:heparinase II/III-like protein [Sphingobacterium alimentarium]